MSPPARYSTSTSVEWARTPRRRVVTAPTEARPGTAEAVRAEAATTGPTRLRAARGAAVRPTSRRTSPVRPRPSSWRAVEVEPVERAARLVGRAVPAAGHRAQPARQPRRMELPAAAEAAEPARKPRGALEAPANVEAATDKTARAPTLDSALAAGIKRAAPSTAAVVVAAVVVAAATQAPAVVERERVGRLLGEAAVEGALATPAAPTPRARLERRRPIRPPATPKLLHLASFSCPSSAAVSHHSKLAHSVSTASARVSRRRPAAIQ